MASISDEDIQRVREANDLVEVFSERVPVKQRGHDFWCCCPFHQEKTPSCKIDPATQLWHCFGCGEGGDLFAFIMKIDDMEFPDAVRYLAQRGGVEITESGSSGMPRGRKARLKEACKAAAEFYHLQLMRSPDEGAAKARTYLSSRGLGGDIPKKWMLGYAPGRGALVRHLRKLGFAPDEMVEANVALTPKTGNGPVRDRFFDRVMFPIRDVRGECIAFGGRVIGQGEPKYLNSQETPLFHKSEVLYGLDKAKAAMTATGTAIIVEGYTDVITLHEGGVQNAVATLGTALTKQHIRQISRHAQKRIVYLFDGDEAGQRAADRALGFIDDSMTPEAGKVRLEICAVVLPDNLDPADFVTQRGADALKAELEKAQPLLKFGIDRRLAKYDLATPEGRSRALTDALSVLAPIKDSLLAKDYAVQIAGTVHAREDDALEMLAHLKKPRVYQAPEGNTAQRTTGNQPTVGNQPVPASTASAANALSQVERNRLHLERELLSLCASDAALALRHAQTLAQIHWHNGLHGKTAEKLLEILEKNPAATPAEIVTEATRDIPQAARILTSARRQGKATPEELAVFISEELSIGDQEEAIDTLQAKLRESGLDKDESEMLFQTVVALQGELKELRLRHKPL